MALTLDEADGYLQLTVPDRTGDGKATAVTVMLDLYEANNKYAQLCDQFDPDAQTVELQQAWVEWLMTEKGVPPISLGSGLRVIACVVGEVAAFKKKHGSGSETADSAATSTSPGSPAPSPS